MSNYIQFSAEEFWCRMENDVQVCLFNKNDQINTCEVQTRNGVCLDTVTKTRLKTIISKSKKRKDTLHVDLAELSPTEKAKLVCHRTCVTTYTSMIHIRRAAKAKAKTNEPEVKRKCRRSDSIQFSFK